MNSPHLSPTGAAPFTKGPWFTDDTRGRSNNLLRVVTERGIGIARINATVDAAANANLIAAAPDLLKALGLLHAHLFGPKPEMARHEIDALCRAALRKARGEA